MNKAKIMLSALGVLAVVGSTLAFKAHKTYTGALRCITTNLAQTSNATIASCVTTARYEVTEAPGFPVAFCTAVGAADAADCIATQRVKFSE